MAATCGAAQEHKKHNGGGSEIVTYVLLLGHFDRIDSERLRIEKRREAGSKRKRLLVSVLGVRCADGKIEGKC